MGSVSEAFSNWSDLLLTEYQKPATPGARQPAGRTFMAEKLLRPLLPSSTRCGSGTIVDLKDRTVGPFDIVGCWEAFPPLGEGPSTLYLADGVSFCIQTRDWAKEDLTQFGAMAAQLKKLERKRPAPIFCAAVSFEMLSLQHVRDFLQSAPGQSVDAVLSIGHNIIVRNSQGWYGDPARIPFVTERGAAESLKSFTYLILQLAGSMANLPFGLSDYQHL